MTDDEFNDEMDARRRFAKMFRQWADQLENEEQLKRNPTLEGDYACRLDMGDNWLEITFNEVPKEDENQ